MSLDWSLGNIKDYKSLCFRKNNKDLVEMKGVTEALIFATMVIGLNEITEKNIEEFYWRNLFCEQIGVNFLYDHDTNENRGFTFEEINSHIGLQTNASNLTRAKFIKNRVENLTRDVNWKFTKRVNKDGS
jgi:hypothetical protein